MCLSFLYLHCWPCDWLLMRIFWTIHVFIFTIALDLWEITNQINIPCKCLLLNDEQYMPARIGPRGIPHVCNFIAAPPSPGSSAATQIVHPDTKWHTCPVARFHTGGSPVSLLVDANVEPANRELVSFLFARRFTLAGIFSEIKRCVGGSMDFFPDFYRITSFCWARDKWYRAWFDGWILLSSVWILLSFWEY